MIVIRNLEHPDITYAILTGYPKDKQPEKHVYCSECGECLDDKTIYEDKWHDFLCRDCLLALHEKW